MFRKPIVAILASLLTASAAWAVPPEIHVAWDESPQPVEDTDYVIDDTDPDFPNVELITGSVTWRIWSVDEDNPSDIGDIGVITSPYPQNFGVKILDDSDGPGARVVKGINLDPQGSGSDGNYSRITSGETTGDLDGDLVLQQSSGGTGGEIMGTLTIGADVTGAVTVAEVAEAAVFIIQGDVTSSGSLDIGEIKDSSSGYPASLEIQGNVDGDIEVDTIRTGAHLTIGGDLTGDVVVTDKIESGSLFVDGNVGSSSCVTIQKIVSGETGHSHAFFNLDDNDAGGPNKTFAGDLVFVSGIFADQHVEIRGELTATGSINLNNMDMDGELLLFDGGGGTILNVGDVSRELRLTSDPGMTFSGSLSVAGVSDGGIFLRGGGDLDGSIHVTGSVSANGVEEGVYVEGEIKSNGLIDIGSNVTGKITVLKSCNGTIDVAGDVSGQLIVEKGLTDHGRIVIDGLLSGEVSIGEGAAALTLIHALEGIGSGGSLVVNDAEGDFDADGRIHFGPSASNPGNMPAVTFDGSVMIKKEDGGSDGGDLNGEIKVVGCHDTSDDLDICICGTNNGTITIVQTNCTNQVSYDCVSGCP